MMNRVVGLRGIGRAAGVAAASVAVALGSAAPGWAQARRPAAAGPAGGATIRDGFEGPAKAWRQEQSDAAIEVFFQGSTDRAKHEGERSEGFEFNAGVGGGLYYSYPLPPIPVDDDLKIGLFVRSNRSGVQLLARVVLPSDVDPDSGKPSFVLVPSTTYEAADRWQKVELADMRPAIERQARVLRASSRRKVSLVGAYVERLIVNIYGGEGVTNVYLDELTIGPVAPELAAAHERLLRGEPIAGPRAALPEPLGAGEPRAADAGAGDGAPLPPGAAERIKFDRNRLLKDGYPWFPTMIRAFDLDPVAMRQLGSDVAVVPVDANLDYADAAIRSGLLLMPELGGDPDRDVDPAGAKAAPVDPGRLVAAAANFPRKEHVFAWSVGDHLGAGPDLDARKLELRKVREAIVDLRRARPGGSPYATGTVTGMLPEYARIPENLDMIGIPASTWATTQGPYENYSYLFQRKLLTARSNADALIWAEVDVTAPPIYRRMIWGVDRPPTWGIPRVQPEQIRTAAYAAIAAGCRGICFKADGDLSQGPGRIATIEMALLNEEFDLLEPILADPDRTIRALNTYNPDPPKPPPPTLFQMNTSAVTKTPTIKEMAPHPTIKAAAISTKDRRGTLLMVADYAQYAQYQPPQLAMNMLKLRVTAANDALAYLIGPGGVKPLDMVRVPGGHDITLEDFGGTAIVLVTTNVDLKDQIERAVNPVRPDAIALAIEQAELHRAWVAEVDAMLVRDGHKQRDSEELFARADALIKSARDAQERFDYALAWEEARRVARPLRVLMRYHFMDAYDATTKALRDEDLPCGPVAYEGQKKPQPRLIAPIVSAPLASFNTLPEAWRWVDWIRGGRLGTSAVAGDFNLKSKDELLDAGWTQVGYASEDLAAEVGIKKGGPDNPKGNKEGGSNLVTIIKPRPGLRLDAVVPFADHVTVGVRSPAVPVRKHEFYRISVMVYSNHTTSPGAGGLIVRDNYGGERLQYRVSQALDQGWFEVVYYRRIPEDGELSITLGYAGVSGFAAFDDLRVEPVVEQVAPDNRPVAARARRADDVNPDGTPVAPPAADSARPSNRAALRTTNGPIRE